MALVQLPPLQVIEGQDTAFAARFMQGSSPVDLTGWNGTIRLAHTINGRHFWEAAVTLSSDGWVVVDIPASETDAFCAHDRRIGSDAVGVFQVNLNAPDPIFNEIWQGTVAVAGVIA